MSSFSDITPLLLGWGTYVAATASPGPAILTIIETAVSAGRRAGLSLAVGVLSGSMTWAFLTTMGLSALIRAEPRSLGLVQLVGGLYLLWLAFRMARKAFLREEPPAVRIEHGRNLLRHYARGYGVHLTNPKAIMSWIMLASIALPADAGAERNMVFVGGCLLLGLLIFTGFALAFSIAPVHAAYLRHRRPLEAAAAIFFGYAAIVLLKSAA